MTEAPVLFISHGAPTFALEPGLLGSALRQLEPELAETRAILVISAHWVTQGLSLMAASQPETVHDFYGFPEPLYQLEYNAPGVDSETLKLISDQLEQAGYPLRLEQTRGRDHGAWVPLLHLLPAAQVPVLQLSLDQHASPEQLVALGQVLGALRKQGIAIIGSGSLTHNLYEIQPKQAAPAAYVERFSQWVDTQVAQRALDKLCAPQRYSEDFARAHPTAEHYLPLLVALGASSEADQLTPLRGGVEYGVIAMDSYLWRSLI